MTRKNGLPRRVYLRHGAYFYVRPADEKWMRLSAERDGLPAMLRALADVTDSERHSDRMPAVITRWLATKKSDWADKTAVDNERAAAEIAEAFADGTPRLVTTVHVDQYLNRYTGTPRTYNLHRSILRQVLAYAARGGLREGFNPVDNIPQMTLEGRKRWVTDEDVKLLKAAALQQTRNGEALVQMIDLALLTGLRISNLIKLRWQDVTKDGLSVQVVKKGPRLLIEWTPALRAAIKACERGDKIGHVLKTQTGTGYRYSGIRSAWVRACARAELEDLNIHDLRGRAGMDKRDADGLESAKDLLGHRSIKTTEHYVDGKAPRRVKPAR